MIDVDLKGPTSKGGEGEEEREGGKGRGGEREGREEKGGEREGKGKGT